MSWEYYYAGLPVHGSNSSGYWDFPSSTLRDKAQESQWIAENIHYTTVPVHFSGQRCLETGITEVFLQISDEDLKKERMRMFLDAIKDTGVALTEGEQFVPNFPHHQLEFSRFKTRVKPWEVVDEWTLAVALLINDWSWCLCLMFNLATK